MDPSRASSSPTVGTSSTPRPRPLPRRPGRTLTLVALAVTGAAVGFKYVASTMRDNELAQKNSDAAKLYVSVDRSGGGI